MGADKRTIHKPAAAKRKRFASLGGRVYAALKKDIIVGAFPSGEPLTEKVLASRYGGSRTPLREAAVRLQQENLLKIIPKKGYFIAHMSVHELNELYEFRAWIEGVCAEIAARANSDPDQLDALEKLACVQYDNREGYFRFIEADTAFHLGIAKLTGNSMLVKAVADIRVHMERLMYAASSVAPYSQVTSQEHRSIIAAIRNRNAKLARKLVHSHILDAKENILKLAGGRSRL